MHNFVSQRHYQSGAALIVSMVLLLVLTILAISTMRTASLEIAMAGNAQFADKAFQLAEMGLDQHIAVAREPENAGICDIPDDTAVTACDLVDEDVAEMDGSFTTESVYVSDTNCPGGNTIGEFTSYNFQVQSTGQTDSAGAVSQHTLGWSICRK
ncbi:MAG: hypothetical protein GY727_14125 [Gammaproteobacteria bacterium]|nr:hypothetical protein [Gammaproteobacteria bacterium]MCP4091098.1 hypothetical protein [Gammaproteobacteria bacterium]MCP4277376.1 hypothetical protein [Gammaproteobacteria bacterium]MCP4927786.1 hypothetical protein [Gammaproteobacteria bacterium]